MFRLEDRMKKYLTSLGNHTQSGHFEPIDQAAIGDTRPHAKVEKEVLHQKPQEKWLLGRAKQRFPVKVTKDLER